MASTSPSSQNTIIEWATGVDHAYLNARLFSYVSTKATISTLRFAMKHSSLPACRNLSEELLLMIAYHVREMCFIPQLEKWDRLSVFLTPNSWIWTKSSPEVINAVIHDGDEPVDLSRLLLGYYGEVTKLHHDDVQRYHQILTRINGASKFAKCAEIFTQDFGIRPYLFTSRVYRNVGFDNAYAIEAMNFRAYLTIPTIRTSDEPYLDAERVVAAIDRFSDPSTFIKGMKGLTEEQRRRFRSAANVLGFHSGAGIQRLLEEFVEDTADPAQSASHGGSEAAESSTDHGVGESKPEDVEYDPTIRFCSYAPRDSSVIPAVQSSSTENAKLGKSGTRVQEEFLIVKSVFREDTF